MNLKPFFGIFVLALLAGCAQQVADTTIGNETILNEVTTLNAKVVNHTATEEDFTPLENMLKSNDDASHELEEITTMVKYKEYDHAGHGLSFLSSYLRTGKEVLCPGHALSHYYVFTKHGEDHLAEHALEEAKGTFDEWLPKAKEYDAQYPSGKNVDAIAAHLQDDIKQIEAGNTTADDQEINFLISDGSLCVEQDD